MLQATKLKAEEETENIISDLKHRDIVGAMQNNRKELVSEPFKPFSAMNCNERTREKNGGERKG